MSEYRCETGRGWVLHHGDAMRVLRSLPSGTAGAVVTDPPYATAGSNTNGRSSGYDTQYWEHWFASVWSEIANATEDSACGFVFSDWRMIAALSGAVSGGVDRLCSRGWSMAQALVWDRESIGLGAPFRSGYEMIGFVRGPRWRQDPEVIPRNLPAVVRHRWPYGRHANHGAEKPVDLLRQLVQWTGTGTVLDPFAGSGSAGVACVLEGREYIGIEREAAYFDTALARLRAAESEQVSLFGGAA